MKVSSHRRDTLSFLNCSLLSVQQEEGTVLYFGEDVNADGNDVYFGPLLVSNYSLQNQARFDTPFITTTHDDETSSTGSCLTPLCFIINK